MKFAYFGRSFGVCLGPLGASVSVSRFELNLLDSEDSRKYGVENTCTTGNTLSKAASNYSRACAQMEKERGNLLKALGTQPNVEFGFCFKREVPEQSRAEFGTLA